MEQRIATTSDGLRLAYWNAGPVDAETVVLCHGLAAGSAQFLADAEYFARLGYRVLVPDLRGHGASDTPASPRDPRHFTIALMADDMLAMLDHAEAERVHWVGNSLGGIVALERAGRVPERFTSLATFGTAHALNLPRLAASAFPLVYGVFGRRLTAWSTGVMTTRNKAARPLIARLIAEFDPHVGAAIAENVRRYDLIENALAFTGPMLLLRGGRDAQVNRALARTLSHFEDKPNFTRIDLPEGGHCANLDATDAWRAALLKFWQQA